MQSARIVACHGEQKKVCQCHGGVLRSQRGNTPKIRKELTTNIDDQVKIPSCPNSPKGVEDTIPSQNICSSPAQISAKSSADCCVILCSEKCTPDDIKKDSQR
ncbi:hypothetical protein CEXT_189471 [Caerostris extrusa]|uniref:Uncharacterized protein n=1 Tax=Caerostris extrusa TaxID=172846 RepID=A0AAV4TMN0_CAEEX|nr:hypothetical protein CEXT_189471 [Caerostris extrusa]